MTRLQGQEQELTRLRESQASHGLYLNCVQHATGITMQYAGGPGTQAHLVRGNDISGSKAIQGLG
eukprot:15483217-Alexandrium_andersonii.AAC.2